MSYRGQGKKKILVIGEAPGKTEDERNEPFVGKAGKRLQRELKRLKINLNVDCWKTNAVRCRPLDNKTPDSKTISFCRPSLFAEIAELKPEKILLFGSVAAESVLEHLWGKKENLSTWLTWNIPHQKLNAWISVHYHPSYLERQNDALLDLLFWQQLKKALRKKERPWKTVPNYADQVDVVFDENKVKKILKRLGDQRFLVSFDYETTCLKPEYYGAEIISCAFSNSTRAIAFPWSKNTARWISTILKSRIHKVAANAKFEERWTRFFLGHGVRNWDWDTMLAAHVLNNASGITGLKFQSFVRFGLPPYDTHIKPYLETGKGQHINRIHEIPLKDLLIYNGLDALMEYKLAVLQKMEIDDGSR